MEFKKWPANHGKSMQTAFAWEVTINTKLSQEPKQFFLNPILQSKPKENLKKSILC